MKKKLLGGLLSICLALTVLAPVTAQAVGLNNFQKNDNYKEGQYTDVPGSHTFSDNVRAGYEYGIMQGYGDTFGVSSNITRLASIIVASRLNCIYEAGANTIDQTYTGTTQERYLGYARDHGIYSSFSNYSQPATRSEFAEILSSALPDQALMPVNHVEDNAIPDVKVDGAHASAVYRLYRAGIINGSDAKGTFYPETNITRGAACAIATRMFDPELRKSVDLTYAEKKTFDLSTVPEYTSKPYAVVNGDKPFFTEADKRQTFSFENYTPLDGMGRCGVAYANIGQDIMPTEERGSIGQVKPSGWHTVKYEGIDGKYLYNRCHLIGYQLSAENANERNLITGTRYLNIQGMLPFENMVADYVNETGNHVLYRVTPIFKGSNLVASGVLMEAWSVEDWGDGIEFNVFCYNVQPGISINYATGESSTAAETEPEPEILEPVPQEAAYIANKNSKVFHRPDCPSVTRMKESNKLPVKGTREDLIARGYHPCKNCNP